MNGSCSIGKRWYTSGVRSLYKYPVFRLPDKPELAGQVSKSWHPRGTYVAPLPLGLWDSDQGCSTAFLVSEPSSKKIVEKQPYFFSETFSIHGNHLRIASKEYASWVESREKKMVENKLVLLGKSWFWCIQKVVGHAPQFLPFSWGTACLLISRPCLPARRPMCLRYAPKAIRAFQKTNHKRVTINIITCSDIPNLWTSKLQTDDVWKICICRYKYIYISQKCPTKTPMIGFTTFTSPKLVLNIPGMWSIHKPDSGPFGDKTIPIYFPSLTSRHECVIKLIQMVSFWKWPRDWADFLSPHGDQICWPNFLAKKTRIEDWPFHQTPTFTFSAPITFKEHRSTSKEIKNKTNMVINWLIVKPYRYRWDIDGIYVWTSFFSKDIIQSHHLRTERRVQGKPRCDGWETSRCSNGSCVGPKPNQANGMMSTIINGLVQGKIYKKRWCLSHNTGVSCRFWSKPIWI